MAGHNALEFTDENFATEVLQSDKPVLVDFWAEWCMPCKALGPVIEELAVDFAGKAKVGKVNTESCREAPATYGIQAIPTVLIFNGGQVVDKFIGLTKKQDLQAALNRCLV